MTTITNVKRTKADKDKSVEASTSFTAVDVTGSKDYTIPGNYTLTQDAAFLLPTL